MRIGYIRVSTVEQNDQRQRRNLEKYNLEKLYTEKISAKDMNRPQLQEMLEFAREGDEIYISDFSRLARSTKDLLSIVQQLGDKGIKLISDKENLNTATPQGMLMLTMLAAIYEFERANMLERQMEGIAIAKQNKKYQGRKKIIMPAEWPEIYNNYKNRNITAKKAMELMRLKRNTFYNFVKEWESISLITREEK